ncbi:mitogen-activated protein kinase kinase kinase 7-interacting protein 3 homolog isoform X1 [Acropora millepora]|uniref:mitogen-activated protein kinase kinase kinase 7-interacting protein 3 homolog isoform X1 n=1 Tax=Acropora millepora TaxID=45264 RepID=UPI001CF146A3|nr:mitogen-activated protein kinase kinase kinase 7-interacting protein 3 homolog isoform X1 [Acropora millepora]
MVDAKLFMAAERNGYNGQIFEALKNRFPEISEHVISQTLQSVHGNPECCMTLLAAESDRILYGGYDMIDNPMPVQPSSQNVPIDDPISISIPPSTTSPYLPRVVAPLTVRPTTVGQPSPTLGYVSPGAGDRVTPSASSASYDQTLLCHQRQRLETLRKEIYNEQHKLMRVKDECQEKETEMFDIKYRVAANPTNTDVKHLRDEIHVLREDIDQMTQEIDGLSNGRVVIGHPSGSPLITETPTPVRRAESFPSSRPHSGTNGPMSGLQRFCSAFGNLTTSSHGEDGSQLSPQTEDTSWEFIPPHHSALNRLGNGSWTCAHCTFENHEALDVCEMCERARS